VRIANLDWAERGTAAGDSATALIGGLWRRGATASACALEGRRFCDREVETRCIPGVGDVGEAIRWRWQGVPRLHILPDLKNLAVFGRRLYATS